MSRPLSPHQLDSVERVLNQLAGRVDGLIDMGTLVCLGQIPVDRRAFLAQRLGEITATVDELRQLLTVPGSSEGEDVAPILRGMADTGETLREAFVVLEQFRSMPTEAVRLATRAIANGYWSVRAQIQCIGMCLALPIRYWEGGRAEREGYYQDILDGLYDRCRQERAGEPVSSTLP